MRMQCSLFLVLLAAAAAAAAVAVTKSLLFVSSATMAKTEDEYYLVEMDYKTELHCELCVQYQDLTSVGLATGRSTRVRAEPSARVSRLISMEVLPELANLFLTLGLVFACGGLAVLVATCRWLGM